MSPLDVDRLRADTPGCARVTHLNNAGSALPPAVVTDTVVTHLRREEEIGGYEAHAEAGERLAAVRDSIARLLGARPDQIAAVESATAAWDRALLSVVYSRPLDEDDRILVSSAEYASNVLPMMQLSARFGCRLEFIPDGPDGCLDVAAFRDMIDDDVAIVAVNQCPSQNGLINDVAAVGAALEGTDTWYLVDACQSVGQLPVDVLDIGADFVSATGRKFLRGPRGTGFLYASDAALDELEPFPLDLHSATWTHDGYEVQTSAQRFEYWEKSTAAVLGLGAAVDYALDCGIDALSQRISTLAERARSGLATIPAVTVHDRGLHRSGIVTLTHERMSAPELAALLRAAGFNLSVSTPDYARHDFEGHGVAGLVRVSPHAYNTEDEIDRLLTTIAHSAA